MLFSSHFPDEKIEGLDTEWLTLTASRAVYVPPWLAPTTPADPSASKTHFLALLI